MHASVRSGQSEMMNFDIIHELSWSHTQMILKSVSLRRTDTHSEEETASKLFCFPYAKGSTLGEKNFRVKANSFLLE